jgi:hypothetical protein
MPSKIILTKNKFPIVHIEGNVIGDTGNLNVFKENKFVDTVTDLQNKIFIGFQNIIGITQENIFHNINIEDNKIIFHKYNETPIYSNDNPWLMDITTDLTTVDFNTLVNFTDNLHNSSNINLYEYFHKNIYQDIIDKNRITDFNPSQLVYVLNKISKYDPLMVQVLTLGGQMLSVQYGTSYQLDNTMIYFSNQTALTESLQIDLYFDIYYDNDEYSCANKTWNKQYILLQKDVLLTQNILLNYAYPTNSIIFPLPYEICCPKQPFYNPAHDNYKLGQMASKKIKKCRQVEFSRNGFSIQLLKLNFKNVCAPRITEQNIEVTINNSSKCKQAPKNRF